MAGMPDPAAAQQLTPPPVPAQVASPAAGVVGSLLGPTSRGYFDQAKAAAASGDYPTAAGSFVGGTATGAANLAAAPFVAAGSVGIDAGRAAADVVSRFAGGLFGPSAPPKPSVEGTMQDPVVQRGLALEQTRGARMAAAQQAGAVLPANYGGLAPAQQYADLVKARSGAAAAGLAPKQTPDAIAAGARQTVLGYNPAAVATPQQVAAQPATAGAAAPATAATPATPVAAAPNPYQLNPLQAAIIRATPPNKLLPALQGLASLQSASQATDLKGRLPAMIDQNYRNQQVRMQGENDAEYAQRQRQAYQTYLLQTLDVTAPSAAGAAIMNNAFGMPY